MVILPSLAAQMRGCQPSPACPPRRLSVDPPLHLPPMAADTPSEKTLLSSSAQSKRHSKYGTCFGICRVLPVLPPIPISDRGAALRRSFIAFMKAISGAVPCSPSVSFPRMSMDVSLGWVSSSFASCSPSFGVSSQLRRSMNPSPCVVRAKQNPARSMIRAGPRALGRSEWECSHIKTGSKTWCGR